ncbi:MAG: hypothetical protein AAB383_03010 [Patescibacteria group bacterium]
MTKKGLDQVAATEALPAGAKMDARGEIMFLALESKQALLEQARDKYHPAHWYCADLITRAMAQGKVEATQKLFVCFDKWIASPKDPSVQDRLFDMLDVDASTKRRLASLEKGALVSAAMEAGSHNVEQNAALALYALLNSPSSSTSASPDQRTFNERLFKTSDPETLVAVLEHILNISAA